MTGLHLAMAVAATVVVGLLAWSALERARTRIDPLSVPDAVVTRECGSASCLRPTLHVVLPCKAALCTSCGHENPAPIGGAL